MQQIKETVYPAEDWQGCLLEEGVLDVNYLGRYASTTLAAFELFLS
ncbi:Uncharacterised protein [Klebsiella pneumoniae]|nr:Uncharacterised protein [Klebsiella pneumoniae]